VKRRTRRENIDVRRLPRALWRALLSVVGQREENFSRGVRDELTRILSSQVSARIEEISGTRSQSLPSSVKRSERGLKMETIGDQNGIEAARRRENEFHPKDQLTGQTLTAWDKRSHTLQLLVGNTNDLIADKAHQDSQILQLTNRVTALEAVHGDPFPGSG
jgi:hypothetical protein